jgi:hypothetical protein
MRKIALALGFVVVIASFAVADGDKAASKPLGTWKRSAGDNSIIFEFKTDVLRCTIATNGNTIEAEADYGITKDGIIFGRISKVTKKGTEDGPTEGELFSFRIKVEKDMTTVSDLKTSTESPEAQQLLHGEYKKEDK